MERTSDQILALLRRAGATGLRRVVLRENRRTIWSLTRGGTTLNLHVGYRRAPDEVLLAFAVIAREAGWRTAAYRAARSRVAGWAGLRPELERVRAGGGRSTSSSARPPCCATPAQRVHLRRLYRLLNATHFDGLLPEVVPLRLSRRFSRRIGQMVPGRVDGRRIVAEIALDVDLMLAANDALRIDTLLHEMAHAANWLFDGEVGHGRGWRAWARRAGCRPRARCEAPMARRRRRDDPVVRVPPLPRGWRTLVRPQPEG